MAGVQCTPLWVLRGIRRGDHWSPVFPGDMGNVDGRAMHAPTGWLVYAGNCPPFRCPRPECPGAEKRWHGRKRAAAYAAAPSFIYH